MQYLCKKQLSIGCRKYNPGDIIPDGVVFPERSGRLKVSGHIAEIGEGVSALPVPFASAELLEAEEVAVLIEIGEAENGEKVTIPATEKEIQQVFEIMQMNAEDGAKAIADAEDMNVLMLLIAADSRTTIKKAAEKRSCTLNNAEESQNEASNGKQTTGNN